MATSTSLAEILKRAGLSTAQAASVGVRLPAQQPAPTAPAPKIATPPRLVTVASVPMNESRGNPDPPKAVTPASEISHQPAGATAAKREAHPPTRKPAAPRGDAGQQETARPQRERKPATLAGAVSDFLEDGKPKVRLAGDNRILSDVASELGKHLAGVLFVHNGEVTEFRDNLLAPVAPQRFRTLIEKHVRCYRQNAPNGRVIEIDATLSESDSRGILASPFFLECLRPLRHLNTVRLPVLRADGSIDLLCRGYDRPTGTLTATQGEYSEDMSFESAQAELRDLFGEFRFADGERSRSVAVSALVGLYAKQLLRPGELRPAFTYLKNAEGSGATTCAACAIVPLLGALPIGSKAKDDDEMRKALTSAIRAGQEVIFLDNLRGQLNSPALEAFVTAPTWTDRLLGANEVMSGPNTASVFLTSNGLTITPDWRRRSLFIELHLDEERAEDRIYKRPLSVPVLQSMRPQILAACWSLVRHWDDLGRPQPTRSHSAFPAWAATIGGIVECAGFGCALQTANVAIVADEDGQNMRLLTAQMAPGIPYTAGELVNLCRTHSIFDSLVGSSDADMGRAQRSAFGKLLSRYDDRRVGVLRFHITGTNHAKRFRVLRASDIGEQAARETKVEADAESSQEDRARRVM
jgi:hypothetical protein